MPLPHWDNTLYINVVMLNNYNAYITHLVNNEEETTMQFVDNPKATVENAVMLPVAIMLDGRNSNVTVKLELVGDAQLTGVTEDFSKNSIATFSYMRVDKPGTYTLRAVAGATSCVSDPFIVLKDIAPVRSPFAKFNIEKPQVVTLPTKPKEIQKKEE